MPTCTVTRLLANLDSFGVSRQRHRTFAPHSSGAFSNLPFVTSLLANLDSFGVSRQRHRTFALHSSGAFSNLSFVSYTTSPRQR